MGWASLGCPHTFDALVLDRDAVASGELWRFWTGHLVHLGPRHALLNIGAMAILCLLAARLRGLGALLRVTPLLMPVIAIGLLLAVPGLEWYAGLSGLLHGWAAWLLLRHRGRWIAPGLLLLAAKLVWEAIMPAATMSGLPVVSEAHWIGALAGAAAAWLIRKRQ